MATIQGGLLSQGVTFNRVNVVPTSKCFYAVYKLNCHSMYVGITINALAPAVVRTAMVEAMNPSQVKYMTDKIPMQR